MTQLSRGLKLGDNNIVVNGYPIYLQNQFLIPVHPAVVALVVVVVVVLVVVVAAVVAAVVVVRSRVNTV